MPFFKMLARKFGFLCFSTIIFCIHVFSSNYFNCYANTINLVELIDYLNLINTHSFLQECECNDGGQHNSSEQELHAEHHARGKMSRPSPSKIRSQSRNIIMNVHDFFENDDSLHKEVDVIRKTAAATGVCVRTVQRIKAESRQSPHGIIISPQPTARPLSLLGQLDDFDLDCIRRELLDFYERGELPTLNGLLELVKKPQINFKGSRSSLYKIVKQMGFKYKKVQSGRKILMEREDIVTARHKYLREIKKNRECSNPREEIYLDETWINQNVCVERCWTDSEGRAGPKLKSGRGARFIIVHAGGRQGFVPGGLLMFRSKTGAKGDYHDAMDHQCFKTWFKNQLLPNIPSNSLIIMDNASYHSKILNKMPVTSDRKHEIIEWMQMNKITCDPSFTKMELLQICKRYKHKEKYETDELANHQGHQVLRLPPYHCMLNPIELIWAQVKSEIKRKNSNANQNMKIVEEITLEAINKITADQWQKCIDHTVRIEEDYRKNDRAVDHLIEKFIINLTSDDSSEEEIPNE